jgi:hypothetical protein
MMIERVAPAIQATQQHNATFAASKPPKPSIPHLAVKQRSKFYFRIATGTRMQYPTASKIGAIVSPPRAKSANPAMMTIAAIAHHIMPRVRDDASFSAIGDVV